MFPWWKFCPQNFTPDTCSVLCLTSTGAHHHKLCWKDYLEKIGISLAQSTRNQDSQDSCHLNLWDSDKQQKWSWGRVCFRVWKCEEAVLSCRSWFVHSAKLPCSSVTSACLLRWSEHTHADLLRPSVADANCLTDRFFLQIGQWILVGFAKQVLIFLIASADPTILWFWGGLYICSIEPQLRTELVGSLGPQCQPTFAQSLIWLGLRPAVAFAVAGLPRACCNHNDTHSGWSSSL